MRAAAPYLREALIGEAVLTIGGPLHEHAAGTIDGVVSVEHEDEDLGVEAGFELARDTLRPLL